MDNDGVRADDNSEYAPFTPVRSRAKQFEGDQEQYGEEPLDHVPYKYDDALKYRFPEQKKYVAAHNYIPAPAVINQSQPNTAEGRSFQRFNYVQPSFNRDRGSPSNVSRTANWRDATNKQSPYGAYSSGVVRNAANAINTRSNTAPNLNASTQSANMRGRTSGNSSQVSGSAAFVPPVYTYDDERMLLQALQDGTYGLTAISDAATAANAQAAAAVGGASGMPDQSAAMYSYQRLHPLSTSPATGEKAYFNMNPRIYDYRDNTYHPIKMADQLPYAEERRLFSMGLSPGDIA